MSDVTPEDERDLLAAEYALGLLDGADLREAQALMLADRAFAAAVERWELRLAPLAEQAPAVEPPADLWQRISGRLPESGDAEQVTQLRRAVRRWQAVAVGLTAVAASLALVALWPEAAPPAPSASPPVLIAALSSKDSGASLTIAYDDRRGALVVSPGVLEGAQGHDHELWVIPAGGEPVSLGLVRPGARQELVLPTDLRPHLRGGSTVAVSVEPVGGSRTGKPTGPVIAAGELSSL